MSAPANPLDLLAAQLAQTILGAASDATREPFAVGVVSAVDGSNNATVDWRGDSYVLQRIAGAYPTPLVGDVVLLARPKDQLIILGKIA